MSDEIEVHPLFVDDTGKKEPLDEPIGMIDVKRLRENGQQPTIGVVPASELPDELALLSRYGAGTYVLIGRNLQRSRILRRAVVAVEDPDAPEAAPAAPAATPATAAPAAAFGGNEFAMMMMKMMVDMANNAAVASKEHAASMVKAVAELSGARLADQRDMIKALGTKENGSPAQYEKGLELGLSLAQVMAENSGGGDVAEIVQGFAQGLNAMESLGKSGGAGGGNGAAS